MVSANIISGNLTASISDHVPQFLVASNIFSIPHITNLKNMKETGQHLIKKILCVIIFQLT